MIEPQLRFRDRLEVEEERPRARITQQIGGQASIERSYRLVVTDQGSQDIETGNGCSRSTAVNL